MASFETEEGTLRLNIFRPSKPPSDSSSGDTKLPVVVYVHGGAYMFGHPLERDLASLVAWAPRDVLVVAAGYRLGALGFKTGDGGEGDAGAELNLGLRDQRAAVDWVVRSMGRGAFYWPSPRAPGPSGLHQGHPRVRGADCPVGPFTPGTRGPSLTGDHLDALERLYPDPVTGPSKRYKNAPGCRHGAQFRRLHEALSCAGARVYLYEYAATSEPFGAASHGDQAPVVAHDMETLRGQRGLVAVAEEMTSRWGQFMASPTGEIESWPRFQSPFDDGRGGGELLVFGKGNDEAAGGKSEGVAVRKRILTDEEMAQYKFWWERMELSQGMGVSGQYRE
ncbi:Carboxylesterase, type B, partial [Metarhizium majus ARSEF 297]